MRSASAFLVLALAVLLVQGCSSAKKRGREALEKGLYDDALVQYEDAVAKDPNDEEARAGLDQARAAWTDRRLIDVRMARLGGNSDQSLDLLLKVIDNEKKWNKPATGKVAFTQDEESGYAMVFVSQRVTGDLGNHLPLRSVLFLKRAESVFTKGHKQAFTELTGASREEGRAVCHKLRKEKFQQAPYFARFVSDFCTYFGETRGLPKGKFADEVPYFNRVAVGGAIEGLSRDQSAWLKEGLEKAIERTAWFDTRSKSALSLPLSGKFTDAHTREVIQQTHFYMVSEPYTEYVSVQKPRTVPRTVSQMVPSVGGGYHTVDSTQYDTVYDTVSEPQTRYRQVQHSYQYSAIQHVQHLTLQMTSHADVLKDSFDLSADAKSDTDGIEHGENQPSIGLEPSHPNLPDPDAWMKTEAAKWIADFESKLVQQWKKNYCGSDAEMKTLVSAGNSVQRCLRQKSATYPAFAENWYQTTFGVGPAQALDLFYEPR